MHTQISHCTGKACMNFTLQSYHTSVSRTIPMNFLLSGTWSSDSVCTHATLQAFFLVALCPFFRPIILMIQGLLTQDLLFFRQTRFSHITFFVVANSVQSLLSSIMYSDYAWVHSDVHLLVLTPSHQEPERLTRCCTLQSLHTVTLRMISTCFLINVSLCCDKSCTRAMLFTVLR